MFYGKSYQTYIIMSQALAKAIPNAIICPDSSLTYKSLQHFITEYYR